MSVPQDFGLVDKEKPGTPISNKDTILSEIDQSLGYKKPPDLEYILVRPYSRLRIPFTGYGINYLTFGHSAVRYTLPETGQQVVVNIEGKKEGTNMVQFRDPTEYFYGTDFKYTGEQLGVYNRAMVTVRVQDVQPEKIMEMHQYFLRLQQDFEKGHKAFYILPLHAREFASKIYNKLCSIPMIQYGNCARWTSEGLQHAGIITHKSYWPKAIWINMFENYKKTQIKSLDNMSVISHRLIKHAKRKEGITDPVISMVAPFQTFRTISYFNPEKFAHRIIEVPPNSIEAKIIKIEKPKPPSDLRNILNGKFMIGISSLLTGFVFARQTGILHASRYLFRMARNHRINRNNINVTMHQAQKEAAIFRKDQRKIMDQRLEKLKKKIEHPMK